MPCDKSNILADTSQRVQSHNVFLQQIMKIRISRWNKLKDVKMQYLLLYYINDGDIITSIAQNPRCFYSSVEATGYDNSA